MEIRKNPVFILSFQEHLNPTPSSPAARQRQKLVADFGVTMHIAWARHMLDNREFVIGGGAQPSTEPVHVGGLDGSAAAEERDNYHRDAYTNDRNHASGAPRPGCE